MKKIFLAILLIILTLSCGASDDSDKKEGKGNFYFMQDCKKITLL